MRSIGKSPVKCMDCHEEATVNVESTNPLCAYHARIYTPNTDTFARCLGCGQTWQPEEWDRCPNDECPFNAEDAAE